MALKRNAATSIAAFSLIRPTNACALVGPTTEETVYRNYIPPPSLRLEPIPVTPREALPVGLGEVAKACIMEVMGPPGIVALSAARIAQTGF